LDIRPAESARLPGYQVKRMVNCKSLGVLADVFMSITPLLPGWGTPGRFNTLKKSTLSRMFIFSRSQTVLKAEAFSVHE
jgi:hypothetical protein